MKTNNHQQAVHRRTIAPGTADNGSPQKGRIPRMCKRLFGAMLLIMLFATIPQVWAGDGDGAWLYNPAYGYDVNRGFYVDVQVKYYNDTGSDEGVDWGTFSIQNANGTYVDVFEIDSWAQGGDNCYDFTIKSLNGFKMQVNTGNFSFQDVSTNGTTQWDCINGSNESWCRVRIFIPQAYLGLSKSWKFAGRAFCNYCNAYNFSHTGNYDFRNMLPLISGTPSLTLQSDGYYDLSYSLDRGINKVATSVTLSGTSFPSYTIAGTLAANATSGNITTNSYILSSQWNQTVDLEVKWTHSTSGLVYTSTKTGISVSHIKYPYSFNAVNNNDGTVTLNWTADSETENGSVTHAWRLQYKIGSSSTWTTISTTIAKDLRTYNWTIPATQHEQGTKSYTFRINRACFNEDVLSKSSAALSVNTNYQRFLAGSMYIAPSDNNIYFKVTEGMSPANMSFQITGANGANALTITGIEKAPSGSTQYVDGYRWRFGVSSLPSCVPLTFTAQTKVGNTLIGTAASQAGVMYQPTLNAKIENESFRASKGFYNDCVELRWEVQANAKEFSRFIVNAYLIGDTGNNPREVYNQAFNSSSLTITTTDYAVAPGSFYRYELKGITLCDTYSDTTVAVEQTGFCQAFGQVAGQVLFENSTTGVPDADIIFETTNQDDSFGKNRALDFGAANEPGYIHFPTPWVSQNSAQTIQMWLKLDSEKPDTAGHQLFYGYTPQYHNDTTWTNPYLLNCDFEDSNERNAWTFTNGTYTNKWVIDNRAGTKDAITGYKLYVSNDDGASNAYTTGSTGQVAVTRNIVSTGADSYTLKFDFRCKGESIYDYVKVLLVDENTTTYNYTYNNGDNVITANLLNATYPHILNGYNGSTYVDSVQHITATLTAAQMGAAGTVKKLVFLWKTDGGGGTQPPAAIDNVRIYYGDNDGPQVESITTVEDQLPQVDIWLNADRQLGFELFGNEAGNEILNDTVFPLGEWFHYSGVISKSGTTYTLASYLNGNHVGNLTLTESRALNFTRGRISDDELQWKIDGKADEIRLWSGALTAQQIKSNYNRYISSETSAGLRGYYRCDEPVDAAAQAEMTDLFDISKNTQSQQYNENHGTLVGNATHTSTDVPAPVQLALKAKTTANGSYDSGMILPYGGSTTYSVTPKLGVHQFTPAGRNVIISSTQPTHSGVNFTDNSKFTYRGKVCYSGGNFPVEGCTFSINSGQGYATQTDSEGQPITTNAAGEFTLTVPVGTHTIRVEKNGHIFEKDTIIHNFQDDELSTSVVRFWDKTRLRIVGRVVGGTVESGKPLGFSESANNVGKAEIEFVAKKAEYHYFTNNNVFPPQPITDSVEVFTHWDGTHTNSVRYGETVHNNQTVANFVVNTNSATGEFYADVIPEQFDILHIYLGTGAARVDYLNNEPMPVDYRNKVWLMIQGDTTRTYLKREITNGLGAVIHTDSIAYNDTLVYTHRENPSMLVTQNDNLLNETPFFGEKNLIVPDEYSTTPPDSVPLAWLENGNVKYMFGHPVFVQGDVYPFTVNLRESYVNWETGTADNVPVVGEQIVMRNYMSNSDAQDAYTDSLGNAHYDVYALNPNIAGGTRSIQFEYAAGQASLTPFTQSTIVLGSVQDGDNFMTKGPDRVFFVLRDPPGSNSYAYREAGSSTTMKEGFTIVQDAAAGVDASIETGVQVTTITGTAVGALAAVSTKVETHNTQTVGLQIQEAFNKERSIDVTATLTQRVETSGEPDWVGADADVFVGASTNIIYGDAFALAVAKAGAGDNSFDNVLFTSPVIGGNQYKLGSFGTMALGKSFGTSFFYTQRAIEQQFIPEWYDLRTDLLEVTDSLSAQNLANNRSKPVYWSKVAAGNADFGQKNYYRVLYPTTWTDDNLKQFVDTVAMCNTQIGVWQSYLAMNEKAKVEAKTNNEKFNYSFTSGLSLDYSTKKDSINDLTTLTGAGFKQTLEIETGAWGSVLGGISATVKEDLNFLASDREGNTQAAEETYGFVLADADADNKLTVDIVGAEPGGLEDISGSATGIMGGSATVESNGVPGGFIFLTQGGQTSCPYEDADSTKYYEAGIPLNVATVPNEQPDIQPAPGTTTTRTGVPADGQAFYTVYLTNGVSPVGAWYDLRVASGTNPLGATVKLDGAVLTETGQPIFVPAGETVIKTVSIERGNGYNFDNIKLVLASQCQYNYLDDVEDVFSAIELTARFQTGCSDIRLAQPLNQWLLNTSDTVGIVSIKIDNFDAQLSSLGWVDLQYKASYSSTWNKLKRYYMSAVVMNGDQTIDADLKELYDGAGYIAYNWYLGAPAMYDGNYDIRAVASCINMQNYTVEYQVPSSVSTGIKDVLRPEIFGRPQPRDGVLDVEDEIMIQFNEPIASQMLIKGSANAMGNLYVQGIKNEGQGQKYHPSALHFDGTATATTASDVTLETPFTVEAWVRPNVNYQSADQVLFSHGDKFKVGISGERVFVENNGTRIVSPEITFFDVSPEWAHIAVAVGANGIAYGYYDKGSTSTTFNGNIGAYSRTERIAIGNAVAGDAGANADIHDLRVWNTAKNENEITQGKEKSYLGVESALKHYWRMDEAQGATATDLKSGLTATLGGATWAFTHTGTALSLTSGSNLQIPAGQIAYTQSQDFSVEMWFKGRTQTNATLFSAGNGDGTDKYANKPANSSGKLSIGFNGTGKLFVASNGNTYAATANYLDNVWHHLAFTVNRLGNAALYVDGNQVVNVSAENIGGMENNNSSFYLGQRVWYNNGTSTVADRPFTGKIDNFRIWNAALDLPFIKDNKNVRLNENQPALAANYPFESYTLVDGSPEVKDTLINFVADRIQTVTVGSGTGYIPLDFAVLNGGASIVATDYAPVKMEGPNQDLGFQYVANGDKIIITMTEPRNRIEGTLLTFTADRIQDLNGNRQKSAVVWTALVNQTQLRWSQKELELETQPAVVTTQTVTINNTGGESENFTITGIPTWLQVTPSSGTVAALSSQTITIKSAASVNVGKYEQTLLLNGTSVDQLTVKLNVKNAAPDWTVNPADYEHNTGIIAALFVDGAYSTDTDDKLAAFVGNECRGVANLTYDSQRGRYSVYLTMYSNDNFANDNFVFRIWDASRSEIREATTDAELNFTSGHTIGSITSPVVFTATDAKLNEIPLAAGWSWLSINITKDNMDVQNIFGEVTDKLIVLKNKTDFSAPYEGVIMGEVDTINNTQMYKLRMREASTLHTAGTPVVPSETQMTLNPGWNWIAYTPQGLLTVQQALAGLLASSDDVIKSQTAFATYTNGSWQGSLATLEPGKGYVYQRVGTTSRTFTYPYVAPQGAPVMGMAAAQNEAASIFTPVDGSKYENNMSIIAVVKNGSDTLKNVEVGAFIGDECRGAVRSKDNGLLFLTVAGSSDGTISFRAYNHADGTQLDATQTLAYETDVVEGTVVSPYVIQMKTSGIDNLQGNNSFSIYPNPASITLKLKHDLGTVDLMEIIDASGRGIITKPDFSDNSIDVSALAEGIYVLKLTKEGKTFTARFIKK